MRPVLKSALRLLWRDATTLQLGVDPRHSVVLTGVDPQAETVLSLLDGTRDRSGVLSAAAALGVAADDAEALLRLLAEAGALDDAAVPPPPAEARERRRLAGEAAELSLIREPGHAARALTARGRAAVLVIGCGRIGASAAGLLAAAGIGRLLLRDHRPALEPDLPPGHSHHAGESRTGVAAEHARRCGGASVDTADRPSADDCADADAALVVAEPGTAVEPSMVDLLHAERLPWLAVSLRETRGVIGPLTVPGRTACPRCLDLTRADRDPAWSLLAAQLTTSRHGEACGAVTSAAVAALAVGQLLAHLDRSQASCRNSTLELQVPEWSLRRRAWTPHPSCGCGAGHSHGSAAGPAS